MADSTVFGSTGLVGSLILSHLLTTSGTVHSISRRPPSSTSASAPASSKLDAIVEPNTSQWPSLLANTHSTTVFSALGTTRAHAGSVAAQWKIDHDLNVELATAARRAGAQTFVFVSSAGTRAFPSSLLPYSRMKVGVEDAVEGLGFDHSVVLRLSLILGERERGHGVVADLASSLLSSAPQRVADWIAVDADVAARAAVRAAEMVREGKAPSRHWVLEPADVLRLGRGEEL